MAPVVETIGAVKNPTVDILGIPVHVMTMNDVVDAADFHIASGQRMMLGVVNAAKLVKCRRDEQLRRSLLEANIILADGMAVVWLSRLMGQPLPERVPGIDIMYRLLELSDAKKYAVYLLGARREVTKKVVDWIQNNYPGVRIAGFRDGYFEPDKERDVAEQIKKSEADILFVAMTSPRKENFLGKWQQFMEVPICHGVGGTFDVIAGITKRAPLWMQNCGMEWFYRVIQEPKRMWKRYLVTNTIFIKLGVTAVIKARLGRAVGTRDKTVHTSGRLPTD